jgi:UV DNA damage endonuclease
MLRWNKKYGIKFLRPSSEMFPLASHEAYAYKLAPFTAEALAEAGKVAELGHKCHGTSRKMTNAVDSEERH